MQSSLSDPSFGVWVTAWCDAGSTLSDSLPDLCNFVPSFPLPTAFFPLAGLLPYKQNPRETLGAPLLRCMRKVQGSCLGRALEPGLHLWLSSEQDTDSAQIPWLALRLTSFEIRHT